MANNTIQLKRSSVAGKQPNTSTLAVGELALNLTDQKLYSSNGTGIFEPASNVSSLYVGNSSVYTTVNSTAFSGTSNNATNAFGKTESNLNVNNALTSNNSSYLGGTLAAAYVQNTDSRTLSGNLVFSGANNTVTGNLTISTTGELIFGANAGIYANGSFGTANQVLTTNGTGVYWSTVAAGSGTSGTLPVRQQYTGDGTTTEFTVTGGYVANSISVFLNGVMLRNGTEVTVTSGSTFTISPAPANGALIDVVGVSTLNSNGVNTVVNQQFTANGSSNSFTVTGGYISGGVQVFLNSVKQIPGTDVFITSGNTVNFAVTPANGYIVDVYGFQNPVALSSNVISVGNTSIGTNQISVGNSSVNTQIVAGNVFLNGSTLIIGNTATNVTINSSSISVGTIQLNATSFSGTSNNASYLGGTIASGYQTTAGLSANVATLTANNATNLGGVAAASYVNTSAAYTITGVHTHNANVALTTPLIANGSSGTAGQILTSNGTTGSPYWAAAPSGGVTSLAAGNGITVSGSTGAVTVSQDFYTGTAQNNTSYPIGSYVAVVRDQCGSNFIMNSVITLYQNQGTTTNIGPTNYPTGSVLTGTWRARGAGNQGGPLCQRVA